jgi:hypothetical protein
MLTAPPIAFAIVADATPPVPEMRTKYVILTTPVISIA